MREIEKIYTSAHGVRVIIKASCNGIHLWYGGITWGDFESVHEAEEFVSLTLEGGERW